MTTRYITKTIPLHNEKVVDGYNCDRCTKDIREADYYHFREFTLEFKKGDDYPSGTYPTEGWEVEDLCDECVQLLRSLLIEHQFKLKEL